MEMKSLPKMIAALMMGSMIAVPTLLPATAMAQSHRQKNKNNWRNLGIAGGALGVAGRDLGGT